MRPHPPRHGAPSTSALPADPCAAKILSREQLLRRRAQARAAGKSVIQCHGCFDIVHPGHIRHLRQAKSEGDILLVSITGDTEMNKGTGRPLIPQELRAENLAALSFVDWVHIEDRPTAIELLAEVQPDVYIKGAEYENNSDPRFRAERDAVESAGGRVVFTSGDVVFSSTALIASLEHSIDPYHKRLHQLLNTDELSGERLTRLVASFRGKRVLVVGETIIDTYFLCDTPAVAGESPVLTLRPIERRTYLGGAAIIARHLAALGAEPILITGCAHGSLADDLVQRLSIEGVDVRCIETGHPFPEKQRFLVGAQKVMKLDLVEPLALDAATHDQLLSMALDAASQASALDAAIIADFGLGLLSPGLISALCRDLRPRARILAGDVSGRRSGLRQMHSMDLLCPSEAEVRAVFQAHSDSLPTLAWKLLRKTGARAALLTMGADGLVAFHPRDAQPSAADGYASRVHAEHVPALGPHAVDALGCGDALLASATLALASGASTLAAAFLGSLAASIQAQRLGNTVVSARDLRHSIVRIHTSHMAYSDADSLRAASPSLAPSSIKLPGQHAPDAAHRIRAAS
ncbi:MAG: PfkB family carbohydrate kinase [Phycisphaerales bacterium]